MEAYIVKRDNGQQGEYYNACDDAWTTDRDEATRWADADEAEEYAETQRDETARPAAVVLVKD